MNAAVAPGRRAREEVRCPSCSRMLVLRTGPAITPHFAHRPRQSCRQRPGSRGVRTLRLEQLALFELETAPASSAPAAEGPAEPVFESIPTFFREPAAEEPAAEKQPELLVPASEVQARRKRRRRRKAWLPRLVRWVKAKTMTRTGVPRPSPLKLEETPARGSDD